MTAAVSIPRESITRDSSASNIAGACSGTLLVMLAQNLDEGLRYKSWLVLLAPSLSVFLAVIWKAVVKYYNKYTRNKELREVTTSMRGIIDEGLANPALSDEVKTGLLKERADLELVYFRMLAKRLEALRQNI
jgi:hypothetical protein